MSSSEQAPIVRRNFADRASLIRVLAARMTYRDAQVVSGRTYFYSVSAMDQRGNESARSEEASERAPGNL